MTTESMEDVTAAVRRLWPGTQVSFEELPGGMTNFNWRVRVAAESYVLQLQMPPEAAARLGIDRVRQTLAEEYATAVGLAPLMVARLPDLRVTVCHWVDGAPLPGPGRRSPALIKQLAAAIRLLHAGPCDERFVGPLADPFEGTRRLFAQARAVSSVAAGEFDAALHLVGELEIRRGEPVRALTHGDLLAGNILCSDSRICLIDYEYAAVGDPLNDLGDLAGKNEFTRVEIRDLVLAYGVTDSQKAVSLVSLFRILSLVREGLWAVAASANSLNFDYLDYAGACRARVQRMMKEPEYQRDLDYLAGKTSRAVPAASKHVTSNH